MKKQLCTSFPSLLINSFLDTHQKNQNNMMLHITWGDRTTDRVMTAVYNISHSHLGGDDFNSNDHRKLSHMEWLASSGNAVLQSCQFFKECDSVIYLKKKTDHVMIKQDDTAHWLWRDKEQGIHRHRGVGESPNEKHTLQLHD